MKKTIFCLIIAVSFYGCVTTQPGPDVSMTEGESCVYECDLVYGQCKMGCAESLDGFAEAGYQEQCKFNCRKDMNACKTECNKKSP